MVDVVEAGATEQVSDAVLTDELDPAARPGIVVGVLAATGIVVSLAQTLVVPILGSLPEIFHTDTSNASWIVTATLLAGAVATPVLGRLADTYGKKRMLLIALVPFIAGSIVCALADTLPAMILGRGLQGLAMGMVPLGISLLHDVLPAERVGSGIALMSSSMGIGGALGLPVAAGVAEFADWRVLFWATGMAAGLAALAIWRVIPVREPQGHAHGFDVLGTIGLALGLVPLLLTVSKGAEWGWTSPLTLGGFGAAIVVLLGWGWYELRRPGPLVDLRTTARPVVLLTNIASVLIGFAMYAMNLIVPQVMQLPPETGYGLGQTMLQMGLWMAPMGLGMMAVSNLGAHISRQRGPKVTLTLAGMIALGYAALALLLATMAAASTTAALILMTISTIVVGCGTGFAFGAMPALIMSGVPASEKAAANGFNSLMRSIGLTSSAAVVGVLLSTMSQPYHQTTVPSLAGFIVSLLAGGAAALAAAAVAATIPGPRSVTP